MLITKEKAREALDALMSEGSRYDVERYENADSVPVRVSYLMEWYSMYFRNIPKEEWEEIEDVKKAAWRRFTPEDWEYVIQRASGVYSKMAWNHRKQKYLNQWSQNQMLESVMDVVL